LIAWLHLIFKGHQPTVGVKCFYRRVSDGLNLAVRFNARKALAIAR
jgi:hypothetical protein